MTKLKSILSYTLRFSKRVDNIILYTPFALAAVMFVGCIVYELIQPPLTHEIRSTIYSTGGSTVYYLSMLLCFLYGRKYGMGWFRSAIYTYLCFELVFSLVSVQWCNLDVKVLGAGSVASFRSLLLLPVLCFLLSRFDRRDTFTLCDYLTPYYLFMHGITTHHCWISGCCEGRTMSWGIIDPSTGQPSFPAQPYAIILALGISLWGLLYARKRNCQTGGKVFAVSMIVYGFFRYVMEFFTDDMRVLGALSLYSIYSLLMFILGMLVYFRKPAQPVEKNV